MASSAMFAIGPMLKGALWETTAMPEIRVQAANIARKLLERLDSRNTSRTNSKDRRLRSLTRVILSKERSGAVEGSRTGPLACEWTRYRFRPTKAIPLASKFREPRRAPG